MCKVEDIILEEINVKYPVNIETVNIETVNQLTYEMFLCNGEDNSYYVRITNYKTYEEQVEEVCWTNYLFENGVGVAPVVRSFGTILLKSPTFKVENLLFCTWLHQEFIYPGLNGMQQFLNDLVSK